jgi:hypothetical protein
LLLGTFLLFSLGCSSSHFVPPFPLSNWYFLFNKVWLGFIKSPPLMDLQERGILALRAIVNYLWVSLKILTSFGVQFDTFHVFPRWVTQPSIGFTFCVLGIYSNMNQLLKMWF